MKNSNTIRVVVITIVLLFCNSLIAEKAGSATVSAGRTYYSAKTIYRLCKGQPGDGSWPSFQIEEERKEYCTAYIVAVAEAYTDWKAKGDWSFCLPDDISRENLVKVVYSFMQNRMKAKKLTGISVISHALADAYPCEQPESPRQLGLMSMSELYSKCGGGTSAEFSNSFCTGYLEGVADAYSNWDIKGDSKARFCVDPYEIDLNEFAINIRALIDTLGFFGETNTALNIVVNVYLEQFPCVSQTE